MALPEDSSTSPSPAPGAPSPNALRNNTIEELRSLGIKVPSKETDNMTEDECCLVTMPHIGIDGQIRGTIWLFPYALLIPDLSQGYAPLGMKSDEVSKRTLMPTHYASVGGRKLILCENMVDALLVTQALGQDGSENVFTVAAAPIWQGRPLEWEEPNWQTRWSEVRVVGSMNYARELQGLTGREIIVLPPIHLGPRTGEVPSLGVLSEWFATGVTLPLRDPFQDFGQDQSLPTSDDTPIAEEVRLGLDRFTPVDIHGAYHEGHLYYTVTVLERDGPMESRGVRVLKSADSDRWLQKIIESPSAPGTEERDRIFRLEDGTHVKRFPDDGNYGTWSWESVRAYLANGTARPIRDLLADIQEVLRSRVWLEHDPDYYVLALTIMTSFVQEIFDAVPLILIVGAPGTAKSELTETMASLGANGVFITMASMATISRTIDQCRGLAAFDDLEAIGATGPQAAYSDLRQNLKLSYKKSTGRRRVTDGATGVELRFYGVKVINLTRDTDEILGSRTLQINTTRMPAGTTLPTTSIVSKRLRDDLHTWAFSNVSAVANAYAAFPSVSNRSEEIMLPLRVLAQLARDEGEKKSIHEVKLDDYRNPPSAPNSNDFDMRLKEYMDSKIAAGEEFVVASQVHTELEKQLNAENLAWPEEMTDGLLGKRLRDLGYVRRGPTPGREWVDGHLVQKNRLLNPHSIPLKTAPALSPSDPLPADKDDSGEK